MPLKKNMHASIQTEINSAALVLGLKRGARFLPPLPFLTCSVDPESNQEEDDDEDEDPVWIPV